MDDFVKEIHPNLCIFPALWMSKAYSVMWFALVFISSTLMIVLYSRVLYTLWLKRNDDSELTKKSTALVHSAQVFKERFVEGISAK